MAFIAVTYTFSNGTTSDASQVNQNYTDIINGLSDGTKDISVNAGTFAGNLSISGNTTIGNASSDDLTVTASLASSIPIKTTNTYDIGSSSLGLRALYFGANSQTVKLQGSSSMSATWTFTFPITAGTVNYVLETDGSGTSSWTKRRTTPNAVENYGLSASVGSSALTVTLIGADGNALSSTNYVTAVFRNATLATGTPSEVKITSALTITVSSGSTLGQTSGAAAALYVYLINNAGTAELAISQSVWDDKYLTTTTAEGGGGAADSGTVLYSTTARSNVAFLLIGKIVNTQATAGTWATTPSQIHCCDYATASGERVVARYTGDGSAALDIKTAGTRLQYDTSVIDTHTAVTTGSSWVFTAPISGVYEVSGQNNIGAGSSTDMQNATMTLLGTAENIIVGNSIVSKYNSTTAAVLQYSTIMRILGGQTVYLANNFTTTTLTQERTANRNYINIVRVGN